MNSDTLNIDLFNELFTRHKEPFVRFAESYVRERGAAENLVIDSFVYFWEHRADIRSAENLSAYLLTIVKHKCINHIRREKLASNVSERIRSFTRWDQESRIASLEALDPQYLFSDEIQEIVRQTLENLPEQTRRIFNMSRQEHLPNKEIARRCGISVKGVEFHITRSIKALRAALKDYYPLFALFFLEA